jgi:hypothetical protein
MRPAGDVIGVDSDTGPSVSRATPDAGCASAAATAAAAAAPRLRRVVRRRGLVDGRWARVIVNLNVV